MKAFLFDVDDTLYDQTWPFRRTYEEMFSNKYSLDVEKLFAISRKYSDEAFEPSVNGTITMDEMYIYRIQRALQDFEISISDETALEFQHRYQQFQMELNLSNTMSSLLDNLQKRAQLGIITNGPSGHQWDKVQTLGIMNYISQKNIFVSGDYDVAKPDARMFDLVRAKMNLKLEDCYYIGDSIENDIIGASDAGWKTIWMNRRNHEPGKAKPDYTIANEQELSNLLFELA